MKTLIAFMPGGDYDLKSWAIDHERHSVSARAVLSGHTHRRGWPLSADGKERQGRLRVRDVLRWRQDFSHDEDWNVGLKMPELSWV